MSDPTRYLAAAGDLTEVPSRAHGRGPPHWKSLGLRRQALGNESDGEDHGNKGERGASPWGGESLALGHEAA